LFKKTVLLLGIGFIFILPSIALASDDGIKEVSVWGVSDYPLICILPSLSRVYDLSNEVVDNFTSSWTKSKKLDDSVTKTDFISKVRTADFSFYLGHGLKDPYRLHLSNSHPWPEDDLINNITRSELSIGGDVEFMNFQTCNFLRALNSTERVQILGMMDGVHMMLGYGSTMWMYPGQMREYITRLKSGEYVKNAWVNAAKIYQPKAAPNVDVIAVMTSHDSTTYETLSDVGTTDPSPYSTSNASEYHLYTYTVALAQ
jgi:hypothetical protein